MSLKSERARHRKTLESAPVGTVVEWDKYHRVRCACGRRSHIAPSYEGALDHRVKDPVTGEWRKCRKSDGMGGEK